jgi:hypothetical protein
MFSGTDSYKNSWIYNVSIGTIAHTDTVVIIIQGIVLVASIVLISWFTSNLGLVLGSKPHLGL